MSGSKADCSGETLVFVSLVDGLPWDSSLSRCWNKRHFTSMAAFAG